MQLRAWIDGAEVVCEITLDRPLTAPVFCFSGMVPMEVVDGGTRVGGLGGFTEVALPDLGPGVAHRVRLVYAGGFAPGNRAWLPLGPYLRAGGEVIALPPLPAGVRPRALPEVDLPDLRLCPAPRSYTPAGGPVAADGFAGSGEVLKTADALARRCGLGPFLTEQGLPLGLEPDPGLPTEGYRLTIAAEGVALAHSGRAGALYGAITLATLRATHAGALPCGVIEDAPRFGWRGQHLDCARHFYAIDSILALLDLMALLKLNRFHWHFADDEAFRLELGTLPELAQTHLRGEGHLIPGVFGGGIEAGGRYTRDDAQRVIDHARALNIEVMPEIEVPAHALALARVYRDTRDPGDTGAEASVQGYPENVLNPTLPATWALWEKMVDEVAEIFPFEVLHLGGDELPPETWQGSPAARGLMAAQGLSSPEDLQGHTMHRIASHTAARGKVPAAWEEAAKGKQGIENGAILFSWTGQGPGLAAARAGYKVVMCPGQNVYFDMAHTGETDDWGANWAAIIDLDDTLAWAPVPKDEPELAGNIIGVQGCFWSEFTCLDAEMQPMLAPRILGLAEMAWAETPARTLGPLARAYVPVFKAMGWASAFD